MEGRAPEVCGQCEDHCQEMPGFWKSEKIGDGKLLTVED